MVEDLGEKELSTKPVLTLPENVPCGIHIDGTLDFDCKYGVCQFAKLLTDNGIRIEIPKRSRLKVRDLK